MLFLIILLFAVSCAAAEVITWGRRGAESFIWNEHVLLVAQRVLAILLVPAALADVALWTDYWGIAAEVGAGILGFSFAHNNAYNFGRLYLRWDYLVRLAFQHRGRLLIQPDSAEVIELQQRYAAATQPAWWMVWREAARQFTWQYQSPTTTARFDFTATERMIYLVAGNTVFCLADAGFERWACYLCGVYFLLFAITWLIGQRLRRQRASIQRA